MLAGRVNRQDQGPTNFVRRRPGAMRRRGGQRRPPLLRPPQNAPPPMPDVVMDVPDEGQRDPWVERMIAAEAVDPPPSPERPAQQD